MIGSRKGTARSRRRECIACLRVSGSGSWGPGRQRGGRRGRGLLCAEGDRRICRRLPRHDLLVKGDRGWPIGGEIRRPADAGRTFPRCRVEVAAGRPAHVGRDHLARAGDTHIAAVVVLVARAVDGLGAGLRAHPDLVGLKVAVAEQHAAGLFGVLEGHIDHDPGAGMLRLAGVGLIPADRGDLDIAHRRYAAAVAEHRPSQVDAVVEFPLARAVRIGAPAKGAAHRPARRQVGRLAGGNLRRCGHRPGNGALVQDGGGGDDWQQQQPNHHRHDDLKDADDQWRERKEGLHRHLSPSMICGADAGGSAARLAAAPNDGPSHSWRYCPSTTPALRMST